MTNPTSANEVLKTDVLGRVPTARARQEGQAALAMELLRALAAHPC